MGISLSEEIRIWLTIGFTYLTHHKGPHANFPSKFRLAVTLFNYLIVGGDRGMNRHLIYLSDTPGGELYCYQCLSC